MKFASTGLPVASPPTRSTERPVCGDPRSGFTLFETLIAMLVLSIGLVSLFEAHSRALRTAGTAANYARARILAQGLLADADSGWSGKPIPKNGEDNGFQWSVDVQPETAPWAKIQARDDWKLQHVRVTVSWPGGRQLELDSLKLGRNNG